MREPDPTGTRTPEHLLFWGYGGMRIVDVETILADCDRLEAENDEPDLTRRPRDQSTDPHLEPTPGAGQQHP